MAYSCQTQVQVLHGAMKTRGWSPPPWLKEITHMIRVQRKARRKAQRAARKRNRS